MAFLARENRQESVQDKNRGFGRGMFGGLDQEKMDKKVHEQQLYKQELENQMREKQERKRKEKQLIEKEDQKFMREIEEINRKEKQRKEMEKKGNDPPHKQFDFNPAYEGVPNHPRDAPKPRHKLDFSSKQHQNPPLSLETQPRHRQIEPPTPNHNYSHSLKHINNFQNSRLDNYYDERQKKHKQLLDQQLDELFQHIHSTSDIIRGEQELNKIRMRLKGKSGNWQHANNLSESRFALEGTENFDEFSQFYKIPKKQYPSPKQSRAKKLDYQSNSSFKPLGQSQSRDQIRTRMSQPSSDHENHNIKWGNKPLKSKFLSDRDALDLQISRSSEGIDALLNKLKHQN